MDADKLARLKAYMHAEDEEDGLICSLYEAAVTYLSGAGISDTPARASLYELAAFGLTLGYYDEMRRTDQDNPRVEANPALRRIINQLSSANRGFYSIIKDRGGGPRRNVRAGLMPLRTTTSLLFGILPQ